MNREKMKDKSQTKVVKKLNYFDYAATTPMRVEAIEVYSKVARHYFGNTQSLHDQGTSAMGLLQKCKGVWGELWDVDPDSIYFTGSASEANQLAIQSLVKEKKGRILVNPLDHASVLTVLGELQQQGYQVEWLPLLPSGQLALDKLTELVDTDVLVIICQWVNSETGIIQPLQDIVKIANTFDVPVHCDAVQGFGKYAMDSWTKELGSLVVSGHKFGGPKGCGVVWMNPKNHWQSLYEGTTHQNGFRAGTLDLPSIAATTEAATLAVKEQSKLLEQVTSYYQQLRSALPQNLLVVGEQAEKSSYIMGILGFGIDGQHTMLEANRNQIAFSTGSACKIGHGEAMSALTTLGYASDEARQFVRISFGYQTTQKEVHQLVDWLKLYRTAKTSTV